MTCRVSCWASPRLHRRRVSRRKCWPKRTIWPAFYQYTTVASTQEYLDSSWPMSSRADRVIYGRVWLLSFASLPTLTFLLVSRRQTDDTRLWRAYYYQTLIQPYLSPVPKRISLQVLAKKMSTFRYPDSRHVLKVIFHWSFMTPVQFHTSIRMSFWQERSYFSMQDSALANSSAVPADNYKSIGFDLRLLFIA